MTGNKHAIIIGIDNYHDSLGALRFAEADAKLMRDTLVEHCNFDDKNILLLTESQDDDNKPTYGNIHSWMASWLSRLEEDDLILFYFAGHGREYKGKSVLAPADATLQTLNVTGIQLHHIREQIENCSASQKVMIIDACHSGAGRDVATMTQEFASDLLNAKGIYTIASCELDQISHEDTDKGHGIFTWSLTDAITNSAQALPDGRVTLDAIYKSCRKSVLDWCKPQRIQQEPKRICNVSGEITITQRQLDPAKQLKYAKKEISSLKKQVHNLEKENDKNRKQLEVQSKEVLSKPKSWQVEEWENLDWFKNEDFKTLLSVGSGICVVALVISGLIAGGIGFENNDQTSVPFIIVSIAIVIFYSSILIYYLWQNQKARNKHFLQQVKNAYKRNDYVQGLAALRELKGIGVSNGEVSTIADQLAELALKHGDEKSTRRIHKLAAKRFGSLDAKEWLAEEAQKWLEERAKKWREENKE